MAQTTDQTRSGAPDGAESVDRATVGRVLAGMAGHFTDHRPHELLTPDALQVCAGAEVYNATGRSILGGGSELLDAVTDALPDAEPACTRGQYAVRLSDEAAAHGWDGERAIPTVPAPRPAPKTAPKPKPRPPARRTGVPGPRPTTGRSGR